HAVVVEAQPRDRRRVPPVDVEGLPPRVDGERLEPAAVAHQVAADLAHAALPERVGELPQAGERVALARALAQRVGGEAALAEGRVAASVEYQVTLEHAAGDGTVGVEAGLHRPLGRQ